MVGARTIANSPSSVFISSLHVQPPKGNNSNSNSRGKTHGGDNADSSLISTSPPTFEIASGNFVNAAGKIKYNIKNKNKRSVYSNIPLPSH